MEWHQLNPSQAEKLQEGLLDCLAYLCRLEKRMAERAFPATDPFYHSIYFAIEELGKAHRLMTIRAGKACPKPPKV